MEVILALSPLSSLTGGTCEEYKGLCKRWIDDVMWSVALLSITQ